MLCLHSLVMSLVLVCSLLHIVMLSKQSAAEETGFCYGRHPLTQRCNRLHKFFHRVTREKCCEEGQFFSPVPIDVEASPQIYAKNCQPACEGMGYCYSERTPLGVCRNLISEQLVTRSYCCHRKLFFMPSTSGAYSRWIDIPQETRQCQAACSEAQTDVATSCDSVRCPRTTRCGVKPEMGPMCRCNSYCDVRGLLQEEEDFERQFSLATRSHQMLCTEDYQFSSVCQMYTASCLLNLGMPRLSPCSSPTDCSNQQCEPGTECYLDQWGRPACGRKNSCSSSNSHGPVCASNNVTFENECALKQHNIRMGYSLVIAHLGACRANAHCDTVQCPTSGMKCTRHALHGHPVCVDCNAPCPNNQASESMPSVCSSVSNFAWSDACVLQQFICLSGEFHDVVSQPPCLVRLKLTEEFQDLLNATLLQH